MSHSHQTSADFHGPTEGTSEAGEAKNVTCGWEASAAHVGLSELIRSLTAGSPLPCLSGPEHIFIYKPEANAVCTLALITTGVLHRLRKLKQTQAAPEHRTGWVSSAAALWTAVFAFHSVHVKYPRKVRCGASHLQSQHGKQEDVTAWSTH